MTRIRLPFVLLAICIAVLIGGVSSKADAQAKRVLLLYPYDDVHPSTVSAGAAMRNRLVEKSPSKIEIYSAFLDLAQFRAEADARRSAEYLAEKFAGKSLDLIMPMNSEAERFLLIYREIIGPNVPGVFCCVRPEVANAIDRPKDITGIYSEFDTNKTIELARQLQPDARNLVIVSGSSEIDRGWLASLRKGVEPYEKQLKTEYWIGSPGRACWR